MNILRKLIIMVVFTSALISGCRMLPPVAVPVVAGESKQPIEVTTVNITTPPAATIEPDPIATAEHSVTITSERIVKPRLSYTVSEGERLWAIAKRADVYGDRLLWPLLYQANRDQIKDPRQIYAGQTLTIPRNVSEEEREKARNFAKKSDIFSPE